MVGLGWSLSAILGWGLFFVVLFRLYGPTTPLPRVLVLSLILSRFLSKWAEGSAHNPLFFAGVTLILVITSAFAAIVPALRASSVDPMEALRYE